MAATLLNNPAIQVILTLCVIVIFVLFCRLAKKVTLPGIVKKGILILTIAAAVVFNVLYNMGNTMISASGDYSMATMALVGSLAWVFIFAFALMANTKKPADAEEE